MHSSCRNMHDTTSTPKRRRLGTGRILRQNNHDNVNFLANCSPITFKSPIANTSKRCESPHLPCNQVEYLSESNNTNSSSAEILCSPGVINSSVIRDIESWESLVVSNRTNRVCNKETSKMLAIQEIDDISDDMFYSKLEQSNHVNNQSKTEKEFKERIEQSFDEVNQSIYKLGESRKCQKSSLFETKDSFLLEIKESGIVRADNESRIKELRKSNTVENPKDINEGFYGLPSITKSLFKTYRNIEKFYDWQEECLNLEAIKQRRNLIYALPTSGGKTLVAEVLMLREVIVRKKNALFILPFVAIVQEKIWSLSPFAVQLDFLVEEYAAGKGHIPPKKRRKKNSIYMATIEKGLALVRSLIELDRLNEIGLIVVDELHLIGEKGRGGTLETLLSTVIFTNQNIQIVGMSATIGNLPQLASFLRADVFQRHFRPVELHEYVKLDDMLYSLRGGDQLEILPYKQLSYNYSAREARLDPDGLGALVWAGGGGGGGGGGGAAPCLVFCPTKRNCENVAALLCTMHKGEIPDSVSRERALLQAALRAEGATSELCRYVRYGVAYHHAGLAADERALLEQAFRSGVLCVVCCTSTLAAGVNLPASRVIVRAPRVGRELISLATYRQMAGRAGRAGCADTGESILVCSVQEWRAVRGVLAGGVPPARSVLAPSVGGLLLSAVSLRLAHTRAQLWDLLGHTLLAITHGGGHSSPVDIQSVCDASLHSLLRSGALQVLGGGAATKEEGGAANKEEGGAANKEEGGAANKEEGGGAGAENCYVYKDSQLAVSALGRAAIKGCMELSTAKQLLKDLEVASRSLVLIGSLHLLYLVTPHDAAGIKPDYRHYYSLYCNLDDEGVHTAKILGITEMNAIRMMTGKSITNVPEKVICRFYLALMLHDLWKQMPFAAVAEKYYIARGTVQSVMTSAAAFASSAQRFCEEIEHLWAFRALFGELAPRLQHCAAPELQQLMELPAVRKSRALQLVRAGYKRVEDLAKASVDELTTSISHLSRTAADLLISAARMMLIEKVENLRAEAEDVMEELKI